MEVRMMSGEKFREMAILKIAAGLVEGLKENNAKIEDIDLEYLYEQGLSAALDAAKETGYSIGRCS